MNNPGNMEEIASSYQYAPIVADQEIRVLKVEPAATFTDPIVTSIFVRKIQDVYYPEHPLTNYQCVSYCWRTAQDVQWMLCDGQRLQITKNVDIMLRFLRKTTSLRKLWIDAICIDQNNDAEKAKQVGRMDRIYERADKVQVWLGPAAPEDKIPSAFAILKNWALELRNSPIIDLTVVPAPLLASINAFFARPWFTRRWVLQEVKLAHAVTVHCGQHRISWAWIRHVMGNLSAAIAEDNSASTEVALLLPSIVSTLEGFGFLELHFASTTVTIFELLWNFHFSLCRDERDRLFALYGIWDQSSSDFEFNPYHHCPVTYTSAYASVYTRLATAAVESGQVSTILSHVLAFGSLAQQDPNWPSWVPSWNMARSSRESLTVSGGRLYSEGDSLITVNPSTGLPEITFEGRIHPITMIHKNDAPGQTTAFFKSMSQVFSARIAAAMLCRAMQISEALHDRAGFQSDVILPSRWKEYRKGFPYHDRDNTWKFALAQMFRDSSTIRFPSGIPYSTEVLGQEVDRLMRSHTLFQYDYHGTRAVGVAFAEVKRGDYVFRSSDLDGYDTLVHTVALVLRPYTSSTKERPPAPQKFRIIGYCVDYEPWDDGRRTLHKRNVIIV